MAPAKRKADKQAEEAEAAQPTTLPPSRVTRAAAKRAATATAAAASTWPPAVAELPVKKTKKVKGTQKKEEEVTEKGVDDALSETEEGDSTAANGVDASKTIIIEHCKQCNSFKTRANQVKAGLEKTAYGITVIVNPEKPRRGCFEIREEGGKKFISLLDMKRPFTPMKNLDMDKVISDIIDEISSTA